MKKVKSWMWKTCDCVVLQIHTLPNWSSLSICYWYLCLLSYPKRCPLNLFKLVSMSRVLTGAVSDKKTWFLNLYHAKCSLGILHKTTNLMSLHEWLYTFNLNYYQCFSWNYYAMWKIKYQATFSWKTSNSYHLWNSFKSHSNCIFLSQCQPKKIVSKRNFQIILGESMCPRTFLFKINLKS